MSLRLIDKIKMLKSYKISWQGPVLAKEGRKEGRHLSRCLPKPVHLESSPLLTSIFPLLLLRGPQHSFYYFPILRSKMYRGRALRRVAPTVRKLQISPWPITALSSPGLHTRTAGSIRAF